MKVNAPTVNSTARRKKGEVGGGLACTMPCAQEPTLILYLKTILQCPSFVHIAVVGVGFESFDLREEKLTDSEQA